MREIIGDFLLESDELVLSLDNNLVTLEKSPDDLELLNEIFRATHTIKGTSSFLGLEQVTCLTHKMEDILNKLRKSEMVVTPGIMDILLESVDLLKVLLDHVREGKSEELDLSRILARLEGGLKGQEDGEATRMQVEFGDADGLAVPSPASGNALGRPEQLHREVSSDKRSGEQTIRVDVARLDSLMNLMGELVLERNALIQSAGEVTRDDETLDVHESLSRSVAGVSYITTELQLAVMKMRMQPIGKVFTKFPRLVRDLSRDCGKEIELHMTGEDAGLDKSVIEEIGDPLVHIIRNSCDHGIENPAEREAAGKARKGVIKLCAYQAGSNIVIKIDDDGRGLDAEAIRTKIIDRGTLSRSDARELADREVFQYIFEAGLSTARQVSDISGRGVGMDVVRSNVEKLNGHVELDSTPGVGTSTTIELPLTLAIVQGLLVESDDEVYILPLSSVHETVKTAQVTMHQVNQRPVMRLRDEVIPVINLGRILGDVAPGPLMTEKPYVVVVGLANRKLGINIDRFLGQEEVVMKSLDQYLGATEGIAGAAILGDGRIRLIIDLPGLFNVAKRVSSKQD
ncbi:MAG: chemotaxis protein CheA [Candidatus Zixiibacteriota bacterium]|nr:MAG: chemotaxis protein CheA [candidate division Zixibacteria bacterium]